MDMEMNTKNNLQQHTSWNIVCLTNHNHESKHRQPHTYIIGTMVEGKKHDKKNFMDYMP